MPLIFPVKPSPYDQRDYIYERLKDTNSKLITHSRTPPPKKLDLRPFLLKPRSQGSRGTCCAFACSAIKEYQERIDVQFTDYMSPNSLYFYREPVEGMYCRNAMKLLKDKGIAPEKLFPYDKKEEPEKIPEAAINVMSNFTIKSYAKVTTIEGLK